MSVVAFAQNVLANSTADVPLAPFDRFGGGGGRVAVRATVPVAAAPGDVLMTVLVGSDVLANQVPVFAEAAANAGPNSETPVVAGIGTPSDPITVRLANTTIGALVVSGIVDIQNA